MQSARAGGSRTDEILLFCVVWDIYAARMCEEFNVSEKCRANADLQQINASAMYLIKEVCTTAAVLLKWGRNRYFNPVWRELTAAAAMLKFIEKQKLFHLRFCNTENQQIFTQNALKKGK